MKVIGKIDRAMFAGIAPEIVTDEVILTSERVEHIRQRHPDDYDRYRQYLQEVITAPDYIIRDRRPATAILLKELQLIADAPRVCLALRLVTPEDCQDRKNSVITFWKVKKKEYNRLIRNREVLYKRG